MTIAETSLKHSRRLIPALIRVARLDCLPSYSRLERVENADAVHDSFYNDRCVVEHLQGYSEIWALYAKVKEIEENSDCTCRICEAMEGFADKIAKRAEKRFEKETLQKPWVFGPQNKAYAWTLGWAIVSLFQNRKMKLSRFCGCKSGACVRCMSGEFGLQFHSRVQTAFLMFRESILAEGSHGFLGEVEKFVEAELSDEDNLIEVSKIESIRSEYIRTIRLLRISVKKLIIDIENGVPLKGKCAICLETS